MGKSTLLRTIVCSLFVMEIVHGSFLVRKEAGCKVHTMDGECCVFPFKYNGKMYDSCIADNHDKMWCSTTSDFDSDSQWGDCKPEGCKVLTTDGECCVFPFKYNGKTYKSCTVENHDEMWCSKTSDYDSDSKWGVCKFKDCEIKTTDGRCCVFPFYFKSSSPYYGCTATENNGNAWCGTQTYVYSSGSWGICRMYVDPCDSTPCKNGGTCESMEDTFSCTCAKGFKGKTCEEKVNPCDSSPCKNDGTCESVVDSFNCTCSNGFEGKTCEEKVNPCDSSPCKNGGTCESMEDSFSCTCGKGFEGKTCEEKVNPCDSSPCKNGGICESVVDSFNCTCGKGFEGKTCEEKVNPCDSSPCKNEGTCKSTGNGFTCKCAKGFEGETCEEKVNPCGSSPCKNQGTCESNGESFICKCGKGFEGETCEQKVNPCDSSPCKNEGKCKLNKTKDGFTCECAKGYQGTMCQEKKVNPCDSSPAQNGGVCEQLKNGIVWKCPATFGGPNCEKKAYGVFFRGRTSLAQIEVTGVPTMKAITVCLRLKTWMRRPLAYLISYAQNSNNRFSIYLTYFSAKKTNRLGIKVGKAEKMSNQMKVRDGKCHQVCVAWQSTTGQYSFYYDGQKKGNGAGLAKGATIIGGGKLALGSRKPRIKKNYKYMFYGWMGEVNIWNKVFSQEETITMSKCVARNSGNVKTFSDFLVKKSSFTVPALKEVCPKKC